MPGKGDARFVWTFNLICASETTPLPNVYRCFLVNSRCLLDSVNYSNELVDEASSFEFNLKIHRSSSIVIRSLRENESLCRLVDRKIRPRIEGTEASRISSLFDHQKFPPVHRTPLFEDWGRRTRFHFIFRHIVRKRGRRGVGRNEGLTRCFET